MKRGLISFRINEKQFSAEEIYTLISDGEFFHNDDEVKNYLKDLFSNPFVRSVFWNYFFTFSLDAFYLISFLFDLFLELPSDVLESEYDIIPKVKKCIYCLSTDNTFNSEEHIFPEGLGNDEAVLPKGYVCDTCNNGILSKLDSYLLISEPIAFLAVQYVPYTKSGKLPTANFQNMSLKKTRPGHIEITAKDKTGEIKNKKDLGDGWFSWTTEFKGKRVNIKELARSFYKIGLGMVAFKQGHDIALLPKFDRARDFINDKASFPNIILIRTNNQPHPEIYTYYKDLKQGCPIVIDIFGVTIMINLETIPLLKINDELIKFGFQEFPLE